MINLHYLQKRAVEFRLENGIGPCEPIRLKSWLQKLNVFTVFKPLADQFCGAAYKEGDYKFILINSRHSIGKQHFTIGHELYHHFIQEDFSSMVCSTGSFDKKDKIEYEADWFSAYLLLPENCLLSFVPDNELGKNKISLATLIKIEQFYACSRKAVLRRLDQMDLISYANYEQYTTGVKKSAISLGFDTKLYEGGNEGLVISDYGERARNLYEREIISESHFYSLLKDLGIDILNELLKKNGDEII